MGARASGTGGHRPLPSGCGQRGALMTAQFHERDHADVDEMSGLMLLLAVLAFAGALVFFCT